MSRNFWKLRNLLLADVLGGSDEQPKYKILLSVIRVTIENPKVLNNFGLKSNSPKVQKRGVQNFFKVQKFLWCLTVSLIKNT